MENKRGLHEREWREAPELLGGEQLRAAARSWLEARGLETSQLELRQRQKRQRPPAGKKPPLPPPCGGEKVCFGVALEAPQPRQLLEPLDGRGQGAWLPRVFVECVCELKERVQSAGIFRKSGSLVRQRNLRATLECGERLKCANIHDVASLLKQYLRELPSPLIPHSLTHSLEWAWSCEEGERVELVMCILLQMPLPNLQMARELCLLLSSVANHQTHSLMDSHSLAVVMTPNIIPIHHSNPSSLTAATGIVQLMIDHAHLIGLAPAHVISHAHQLSREGVVSEGEGEADGKREKQKRSSVTDRVLGWGTKLIGSIGGVSRDLAGDNTHSPASLTRDGGLHLESPSGKPLFNPSLPGQVQATPTTPHSSGHKRHRSFLSARRLARRRHNDGRHGHKQSLFPNPFRGGAGKGAEFARLGSQRLSEKRFPWLQNRTPSTPNPDVQLVGFGWRSSTHGETDGGDNDRGNLIVANHAAMTPVHHGNSLPASALDDSSVNGQMEMGDARLNEGVGPSKEVCSVARRPSGKRMRCEVGEEPSSSGSSGNRPIKRRHTIYTSGSRESLEEVGVARIRVSKSASALGQMTSDPSSRSFIFSKPTPQHTPRPHTTVSVAMETDKQEKEAPLSSSNVPFKFSNPRLYVAKQMVVNDNKQKAVKGEESDDVRVCGASPIPHLPELTRRAPHNKRCGLDLPSSSPCPLDNGFLTTPHPPESPDLLRKISSELVQRYPLATPLATPSERGVGPGMNESYRQAVYAREPPLSRVKPLSLKFTVTPEQGSEVMQEVSFSFELNSPGCHGSTDKNPPSNGSSRVPLTPISSLPHRTPATTHHCSLGPQHRPPLQRRFALTPLLTSGPRFTDLSCSPTGRASRKMASSSKTPRVGRRAQMYVIPSFGCHGDKENISGDITTTEWIV